MINTTLMGTSNRWRYIMLRASFIGAFIYFTALSLRLVFPIPFVAVLALVLMLLLLSLRVTNLNKIVLLFFIFLLIIIFGSNLYTPAPEYGSMKSFWFLGNVLMLLIISGLKSQDLNSIKEAIEKAGLIFFPIFAYVFIQYISSDLNIFSRFDLNQANPIIVAQIFLIFFVSMITTNKQSKIKFIVGGGYLIMAIMTGSKGPVFALAIGILLLSKSFFYSHKVLLISILIVVCSTVTFFLTFLGSNELVILDYVNNRFLGDSSSNSVNSRLDLYLMAINGILDFSLFEFMSGKGVGAFGYLYTGKDEIMYPHNILLEGIYELGIIFTGVFFSFLFYLMLSIYLCSLREPNKKIIIFIFLFGCIAFISSMVTGDLASNWLIYMFMGMALSSYGFDSKRR